MSITIEHTERGFARIGFVDHYGERCSLQRSSIIDPEAIWLGIDSPTCVERGWHPDCPARARDYQLPDGVTVSGRMHLTRKQVAELLPLLQRFVATGEL